MALDIGERRIGVAISDPDCRVATPHSVLDARAPELEQRIRRLLDDYEVARVVVGLPLTLEGTEGPQAAHVREAVARLEAAVPVPIEFFDERLSSVQARRSLSESGMSERQMRGRVDMIAASLILQSYLDARRGSPDTD
jgi:putative Holliday junction resolvase